MLTPAWSDGYSLVPFGFEMLSNAVKDRPTIGSITVQMFKGPTVRVVFVRDARTPGQRLAIASTDLKISPERICGI